MENEDVKETKTENKVENKVEDKVEVKTENKAENKVENKNTSKNKSTKKKKKVKMETSKLFLFIIVILTVGVVIFSCIEMSRLGTIEPLTYLIPALFTELAAGTACYYWKAKTENKLKIIVTAINELTDKENLTDEKIRVIETLINSLN